MNKKFAILPAAVIGLSLMAVPVWADEVKTAPEQPAVTTESTVQPVVQKYENVKGLEKAKAELARLNKRLELYKNLMQKEIQREEAKRDKVAGNVEDKETKWQSEIDKMSEQDKEETQRLNDEIQKATTYEQKIEAELNDRIKEIDTKLQAAVAELDKQIAEAKEDAAKQKLADTKKKLEDFATARKAAITKYLEALKSIWADKQKIWDARKAVLAKKQAADLEFKTSLVDARKSELNSVISSVSGLTNEQIEKEVSAKYQKRIDAVNAQIKVVQAKIDSLSTK